MAKKTLITIILLTLVLSTALWLKLPMGNVSVVVRSGDSAREVAMHLERSKVVPSGKMYLLFLRAIGADAKLQSGFYTFTPRFENFLTITQKLTSKTGGKKIKVTIPEGFNALQIAKRLEESGVVKQAEFYAYVKENNLEGYLFPQTYYFSPGQSMQSVTDNMHAEFYKNFTPDMRNHAQEIGLGERSVVILASIIESEAVQAYERPHISSVFQNRLKKGMRLESCATVLYALGTHKEKLSIADTKINSPYNTYLHTGLPPGPICSPGIDSLHAALYPAQSQDLFFVSTGSGTHVFSGDFKEHIKQKIKANKEK